VGHAHKYYELTEKGRATVKAMVSAWRDFSNAFSKLVGDE